MKRSFDATEVFADPQNCSTTIAAEFAVSDRPAQSVQIPLWRFGGGRYVITDVRLTRVGAS